MATTASRALKRPTLEYLQALRTEMEQRFATDDQLVRSAREMREMRFEVDLPPEYRFVQTEVKDETIADEALRATAMMTVNPPSLQVTTPGITTEKAQHNATLREYWTEEVMLQAARRQPGVDTLTKIVDATTNDGGGWCKVLFVRDLWESRYSLKPGAFSDGDDNEIDAALRASERFSDAVEEAKKQSGPPIAWVHVDTLSVYPVFQGMRLGEVLEVQERPQSSTFRQYRLGRDADGNIVSEEFGQAQPVSGKGNTTVVFLEHWDDQFCTYAVASTNHSGNATGQIVKQFRHRYGRVPYFWAPGFWMSHWHNRKIGWAAGKTKEWLVKFRSFLWTIMAQLAARDTLNTLVLIEPENAPWQGQDDQPQKDERIELGVIKHLKPGQQLVPVQFPPVAQSMVALLGTVDQAIGRLESSNIAQGMSGDLGSGYAISQQLSEQRLKFDPIIQSVERMLDEITQFVWHIVREVIREKVWVQSAKEDAGWLALGPDDLKAPVKASWTLNPERPSAKLIESRYWTERIAAKTASIDQAIEEMGDNPDEVLIGRMMDQIRQTEPYVSALMKQVFQQAGMGDLVEQQAEQTAQTGQLGNGLMPPGMTQSGGSMPPMGPGGNAGLPQMQDQAALSMAPNGAGAQGIPMQGSVPGAGPGAVLPQTGAEASMIQPLQR